MKRSILFTFLLIFSSSVFADYPVCETPEKEQDRIIREKQEVEQIFVSFDAFAQELYPKLSCEEEDSVDEKGRKIKLKFLPDINETYVKCTKRFDDQKKCYVYRCESKVM